MKIVFLNAWNGKMKEGITEFIKEQSRDTDIFCLQEVENAMKNICTEILADYNEFAGEKHKLENDYFDLANYVRQNVDSPIFQVIFPDQTNLGFGLYSQVQTGDTQLHVINFHGLSRPGEKLDNPDRLAQCQGLIDFMKDKTGPKIIGGDFNILSDTDSIRMFAENGYQDLIKEFNVSTTRNRLSWEKYPDNKQYYSDYVFVSPDVEVKNFSVPNLEVSDHLPLILEIE